MNLMFVLVILLNQHEMCKAPQLLLSTDVEEEEDDEDV